MTIETTASEKPPIAIEPRQWEELSSILSAHLPGRRVWAFGSRATGLRVKRYSDLDLLIDGDSLTFREAAFLDEALDESRLPFRVDVVQAATLTPEFRARIEPEMVLVRESIPPEKAT
jgi:type I restriction enzyme S subunit